MLYVLNAVEPTRHISSSFIAAHELDSFFLYDPFPLTVGRRQHETITRDCRMTLPDASLFYFVYGFILVVGAHRFFASINAL